MTAATPQEWLYLLDNPNWEHAVGLLTLLEEMQQIFHALETCSPEDRPAIEFRSTMIDAFLEQGADLHDSPPQEPAPWASLWRTAQGIQLRIEMISDKHLTNIIPYLQKRLKDRQEEQMIIAQWDLDGTVGRHGPSTFTSLFDTQRIEAVITAMEYEVERRRNRNAQADFKEPAP